MYGEKETNTQRTGNRVDPTAVPEENNSRIIIEI
jgi:hypothetical protein